MTWSGVAIMVFGVSVVSGIHLTDVTLSLPAHVQGLVLDCSGLEVEPMDELPDPATVAKDGQAVVWLVLDEIEDPVSWWQ